LVELSPFGLTEFSWLFMETREESNNPVLSPRDSGDCGYDDVDINLVEDGRVLVASVLLGVNVLLLPGLLFLGEIDM
jgi:hypothetical protein